MQTEEEWSRWGQQDDIDSGKRVVAGQQCQTDRVNGARYYNIFEK
jgi:hypothetical protein